MLSQSLPQAHSTLIVPSQPQMASSPSEKAKKTSYSGGFSGISKTLSNTSFLDIKKKKEKHADEDEDPNGNSRNRKFICM
jgi:hypothetical protein